MNNTSQKRQRDWMTLRQVLLHPGVDKNVKKSIGKVLPSLMKNAKEEYRRKFEKDVIFNGLEKAVANSRFGDAHLLMEMLGGNYIRQLTPEQKYTLMHGIFSHWNRNNRNKFSVLNALRRTGLKVNFKMYHNLMDAYPAAELSGAGLNRQDRAAFINRVVQNDVKINNDNAKNIIRNSLPWTLKKSLHPKLVEYVLEQRNPGETVRATFHRVLGPGYVTKYISNIIKSGDTNLIQHLHSRGYTFNSHDLQWANSAPNNRREPMLRALLNILKNRNSNRTKDRNSNRPSKRQRGLRKM